MVRVDGDGCREYCICVNEREYVTDADSPRDAAARVLQIDEQYLAWCWDGDSNCAALVVDTAKCEEFFYRVQYRGYKLIPKGEQGVLMVTKFGEEIGTSHTMQTAMQTVDEREAA